MRLAGSSLPSLRNSPHLLSYTLRGQTLCGGTGRVCHAVMEPPVGTEIWPGTSEGPFSPGSALIYNVTLKVFPKVLFLFLISISLINNEVQPFFYMLVCTWISSHVGIFKSLGRLWHCPVFFIVIYRRSVYIWIGFHCQPYILWILFCILHSHNSEQKFLTLISYFSFIAIYFLFCLFPFSFSYFLFLYC